MILWHSARWLYSVLFTCLLPLVFFRLWVRSLRLSAYRDRWKERLGYPSFRTLDKSLWIHAVSLGESLAAIPLVRRLATLYPDLPIVITTTTPTGSACIQNAFKAELGTRLFHCYFPYDLPWTLAPFLKHIRPRLLVIMETELWPNLLAALYAKNIPVIVANGRLSARSSQHYHYLRAIMPFMLRAIQGVAAQSVQDARAFGVLGIPSSKIEETGNIKFDLVLPADLPAKGRELRTMLGTSRLIFIAASTHQGEEQILFDAYKALKLRFPSLLLLLVPRHPDRFNHVAQLGIDQNLKLARRSQSQACDAKTDVYLGDTIGELLGLYAASDVAFVGGSLVPIGGHNLLEPASLDLPIVSGPYLGNFMAIRDLLLKQNALSIVNNEAQLQTALQALLENPTLRQQKGGRAKQVVLENRGALEKMVQMITRSLSP